MPLAAHVFAQADEVALAAVCAVLTAAATHAGDAQHLGGVTVTLAGSNEGPAASQHRGMCY